MNKFIPVSEPTITEKEIEYVLQAVKSGWVSSLGEFITKFEEKFAKYVGTRYALTTSNGTTALHLALVSLGIKEGDEVIVPDLTFIATANAVAYTGAKPVFADIDPETWCIDPDDIKKKITSKTKAIIPVHLYGHPADMDPIMEIAEKYGLFVIEDCAEAHGAEYKGKKVGSIGHCGVFSFYGNKIITTGEGGIITTNDEKLYEKAKFLRDHAMSKDKRYWHTEVGYNYRMTNIQAALGLAQFERIDEIIQKKIQIFTWYKEYLGDIPEIKLNPEKEWAKNVFWMVCLLNEKFNEEKRDEFIKKLKENGIDTRPFFYPCSMMPTYKKDGFINPISYEIYKKGINLPSGYNLTREVVRWICQEIKTTLKYI
ncbi:DegT/DnrJ/EryC1/StrS family aminotransferase [Calditerrivibrio nitroreducens]|uniref:GDP-perosamine synthase n=1 Tax=Calditerrivibrio nitroreducens (strain DSM 19672 / NBRC 101217 / Yu37-1) TaxID=768670 RepID=E4THC5_CALNY|nr:DegT/DnrJ/EryC1/StrS family aminotransferase [Calditerrivibrio nitroreducens]ADR19860.1 DegT/DnrJ/EryC1/StrS aminotransferase [Calditerrivibrio nitroreducens DSM 19672]